MTDTPERIWATTDATAVDQGRWWDCNPGGDAEGYIRADVVAAERTAGYREGLEAAAQAAHHALNDVRCAKCNAPRSDHPYRHPFQPSQSVDVVAAIRTILEDTP